MSKILRRLIRMTSEGNSGLEEIDFEIVFDVDDRNVSVRLSAIHNFALKHQISESEDNGYNSGIESITVKYRLAISPQDSRKLYEQFGNIDFVSDVKMMRVK